MAKWDSTGWVINQLESEVGMLVEQGVIDLEPDRGARQQAVPVRPD